MVIKNALICFHRDINLSSEKIEPVLEKICEDFHRHIYNYHYETDDRIGCNDYHIDKSQIILLNRKKSMMIALDNYQMNFLWVSHDHEEKFEEFNEETIVDFFDYIHATEFLKGIYYKKIKL